MNFSAKKVYDLGSSVYTEGRKRIFTSGKTTEVEQNEKIDTLISEKITLFEKWNSPRDRATYMKLCLVAHRITEYASNDITVEECDTCTL